MGICCKLLVLVLFSMLAACKKESPYAELPELRREIEAPELQQGVAMIRSMMMPPHLTKSIYSTMQDGKVSTFVNFMFSDLGTAEWPIVPKGVAFVMEMPNLTKGRQVVLKAEESLNVLIVEAYDNPNIKPAFTVYIPLPKVWPAPGVVVIAKAKEEERRLRSLSIWKVWLLRHGVGVKASVNATLSTPPTPL